MAKRPFWYFLLFLFAGCVPVAERPPNVVIIYADDMGYADLGVYGATGYATPHLDRMAAEGMRFTQFYMPTSACSPSRAALMTGSYPLRVGMPHVLSPRSRIGLNPSEQTIAEVLRDVGYATAAIGKWHLGDHPLFLPTSHGFDTYFGLPYSNDMSTDPRNNPRERARRHPPLPLLRDTTIIEREPDQSQLIPRYTETALQFIKAHRNQPFFLYYAHSFPHVPLYASSKFAGTTSQGTYGDVVAEIDDSVGQILTAIRQHGLDEHTLVIFTSDNGPWLIYGDHAGSAGPFREGKGTSFEGGHRVPGIMRWPGHIPAGRVSDALVTVMDLLPTVAFLAEGPDTTHAPVDGYNIWSLLSGAESASPYPYLFYYRGGQLQAVREGSWKLHVPHTYRTIETGEVAYGGALGTYGQATIGLSLFHLEQDPGEQHNVADKHPDVVERLMSYIEAGRQDIGDRLTETVGNGARAPGRVEEPWSAQVAPYPPLIPQ